MPDALDERTDTVDVVRVIAQLKAHRMAIAATAVVCAVIGYTLGVLLIKNRADSFLQISYTAPITAPDEKQDKEGKELRFRLNIAEYKVLSASLLGRNAFLSYATRSKRIDPELVQRLDSELAKDNLLARWIHPVFALARTDLRDIPDQPREEANYLVGVEISVDRRSPNDALALAGVLGDYVRDSVILLRANEFAIGLYYKASNLLLELDRRILTNRLKLDQAEQRHKELLAIRSRYPDTARGDVRQVVSVDKGTARFLPPVSQLVGVESEIADTHETLRIAEWDIERAKAIAAYLEPVQRIVRNAATGTELFAALDRQIDQVFTPERLKADAVRDAYTTLKIEIFGLKTLYFERMRVISGPVLNEIAWWVRALPAVVGLLVGAVLATLIVLVRESFASVKTTASRAPR